MAEEVDKLIFYWALKEWERELLSDFSLVRQVTGNAAMKTVEMFERLRADERPKMARAMTKRFHKEACAALGEPLSAEEVQLLDWAAETRGALPSLLPPVRPDQTLRKEAIASFKKRLHFLGVPSSQGTSNEWQYVTPIGDWRIVTRIGVLGRFGDCSYSHTIESVDGNSVGYLRYLSLLSWLGISSETKWRVANEGEVADAAEAMASLCEHFLSAAPHFLLGTYPDR